MPGGSGCWGKMKLSRCGKIKKRRVKIVIKWSKDASREVQKTKMFLPWGRGHPFFWTQTPAVSALRASAAETWASLTAENINFLEGGVE